MYIPKYFIATLALVAPSAAFLPATGRNIQNVALDATKNDESSSETFSKFALASLVSLSILANPLPAIADGQTEKFKLPPIDFSDKNRCRLDSSSIGQANAARDKLYDLRQCNLSGKSAVGFDLSGVIMTGTDVSKTDFTDAYFSKGYLRDSNFDGADFSNAIVDRASFKGSTLRGAIFNNAVVTGTSFDDADVEGADFTEAAIGLYDVREMGYLADSPKYVNSDILTLFSFLLNFPR